jgi:Family of unknown function (DUF6325)
VQSRWPDSRVPKSDGPNRQPPSGPMKQAFARGSSRSLASSSSVFELVTATGVGKHEEASLGFGPVDVVIIGFPGNRFSGQIAPAIMELVETGTIRVIDLLFVTKDPMGVVTTIEMSDLDPDTGPAFTSIDVVQPGALGPEDAEEISEDLELNSSALLVAFENSWAAKVVDACRAADGVVIDQIRIPADVVDSVLT